MLNYLSAIFIYLGPSDKQSACIGYEKSASLIKSRVTSQSHPASRFVTWANNHGINDKCLSYADVVRYH
jgi:hypothetical protein